MAPHPQRWGAQRCGPWSATGRGNARRFIKIELRAERAHGRILGRQSGGVLTAQIVGKARYPLQSVQFGEQCQRRIGGLMLGKLAQFRASQASVLRFHGAENSCMNVQYINARKGMRFATLMAKEDDGIVDR
ncbi:MAG: hypothetical protein ACRYG5_02415 [Janthinobacterium lividum]